MQLDKTNDFHSKDRQQADVSLASLETLKELMKSELQNCNVSDDPELSTIGQRIVCPKVVMNERHKMARNRLQPLKAKLFPTPSELTFVSAKKLIRDEQSKVLHEKEKRFVARAIVQLEREFLSRRNRATLSLLELEKQNKERTHSDVYDVKNKKDINNYNDPADFLTNIQKAYERLHRNLLRSQYFESSAPEKQRTTSHIRRDESFGTICPTTPTEKEGTNNEGNGKFQILTPIKPIGKEDKINQKMDKADLKLNKIDNCQGGTSDRVVVDKPDEKTPTDNCHEKISNATEQALKWKMLYYWRLWRKVTLEKKKENNKLARIEKIDSFLTRLTKAAEQVQQLERLANEVARQSSQNKSIPETNKRKKSLGESDDTQKLNKIEKELIDSTAETYERLNKSLKMFHPNLHPKLKALSVLSSVKNKYRIVGTETTRVYPTPAFLTEMENRYKERKTRWENIRKKRLEMEAEKERIMREREEEEKKLEDLKKREKLEELKEKRRREKEAEEERKRERRLLKQQLRIAHDHYARYLMKKVGFQSLQRLIQLRRNQMESAYLHMRVRTCNRYLMHWRSFTASQLNDKERKAQELYEKILLKKSLHSWILEHVEYVQKVQVAMDWSEAKLSERAFATWFDNAQAERWYSIRKTEFADSFYVRKLLARCITKWKEFPELIKKEKEREKRKKVWQRKVQEFLPDYQPTFISEI